MSPWRICQRRGVVAPLQYPTPVNSSPDLNLDAPPTSADGVPPPTPLKALQSWGIQCSVPPSEVTEERLLAEKIQDATQAP